MSAVYLQNYTSYGYEILLVDRSHQGGVQCTGTITLVCLRFELLPSVYFHTLILSEAYLQNYTSYGYEILWVDRSHQGGVQCTVFKRLVLQTCKNKGLFRKCLKKGIKSSTGVKNIILNDEIKSVNFADESENNFAHLVRF